MASIYKMTNTITGEIYIGCTTKSVNKRFMEHKSRSKADKYLTIKLYKSIREYGFENFIVEELFKCDNSSKELFEIETIAKYDSFNNGLNHTIGGKGIIGYEYNETHRKKALKTLMAGDKYRKGKNYGEIYGEKSVDESEKRKLGVKKSWDNMSSKSKFDRIKNVKLAFLKKSGYSISEIIKIKELYQNGMKPAAILSMFDHLTKYDIKKIVDKRKYKDLDKYVNNNEIQK